MHICMLSPPQRPIPKSRQLNEFPEKIFYLLLVRFILLVSKTRQEEEVLSKKRYIVSEVDRQLPNKNQKDAKKNVYFRSLRNNRYKFMSWSNINVGNLLASTVSCIIITVSFRVFCRYLFSAALPSVVGDSITSEQPANEISRNLAFEIASEVSRRFRWRLYGYLQSYGGRTISLLAAANEENGIKLNFVPQTHLTVAGSRRRPRC